MTPPSEPPRHPLSKGERTCPPQALGGILCPVPGPHVGSGAAGLASIAPAARLCPLWPATPHSCAAGGGAGRGRCRQWPRAGRRPERRLVVAAGRAQGDSRRRAPVLGSRQGAAPARVHAGGPAEPAGGRGEPQPGLQLGRGTGKGHTVADDRMWERYPPPRAPGFFPLSGLGSGMHSLGEGGPYLLCVPPGVPGVPT